MYLSSTAMVRRNSRPSPLSHLSVTGRSTSSAPLPACCQSVSGPGSLIAVPPGGDQPNSA